MLALNLSSPMRETGKYFPLSISFPFFVIFLQSAKDLKPFIYKSLRVFLGFKSLHSYLVRCLQINLTTIS